MTKNEAVGFYHGLMRFGVKPGLERISILLERLDNPQNKLRFIHVAGTNGKGSVCTEISNILRCAGYNTGLYTSPFVIDFSERIQFNNRYISDTDLSFVTETVSGEVNTLAKDGIIITEFEAITAAAFLYFLKKKCDIVVLETGLGGRFDATNIIVSNICSVITSVSLDHTAILGNTIKEIAFEKCGIFKKDRPVIFGDSQSEDFISVAVTEAEKKSCPVYIADSSQATVIESDITGTLLRYGNLDIKVPFCGKHQVDNAVLVLSVIEVLIKTGFSVSGDAIVKGFASSFIPARTEIISDSPLVIIDGCHNPDSTKALSDTLHRYLPGKKILGVTAMMNDKDCSVNFENLCPCFRHIILTESSNPRTASARGLSLFCSDKCEYSVFDDRNEAVSHALAEIENYDCTVFFGSLYFAADVRDSLRRYFNKEDQMHVDEI